MDLNQNDEALASGLTAAQVSAKHHPETVGFRRPQMALHHASSLGKSVFDPLMAAWAGFDPNQKSRKGKSKYTRKKWRR